MNADLWDVCRALNGLAYGLCGGDRGPGPAHLGACRQVGVSAAVTVGVSAAVIVGVMLSE